VAVAGADQGQPVPLRTIREQSLASDRAAQVLRQRAAHAHGKNAGLFQRPIDHRRTVAGGEHQRIRLALQRVADADETALVQRQSGIAQPGRAPGLGDPDDFVGRKTRAAARLQATCVDPGHFGIAMHGHATLGEHAFEGAAHGGVVGRQDMRLGGKKVKARRIAGTAQRGEFAAQAVLHRQQQLDAARPGPDHRDRGGAGVTAHAIEQRQPAIV
jgi:hypothetical protein